MIISGGLSSKILVMTLAFAFMFGAAPLVAMADQEEVNIEASPSDRVVVFLEAEFPEGFKWEYTEGDTLDLTGLRLFGYFSDGAWEELYDFTVFPEHGTVLGGGDQEIVMETILYLDGAAECYYSFNITVFPAIKTHGVTPGNRQAFIAFPIISANGKGYTVYLSTANEPDSFVQYDLVNYSSQGAHIKGLANDTTYYAYIEYSEDMGNITRSGIVELIPQKP